MCNVFYLFSSEPVLSQVNKIRECPLHPHMVVTHTDAKELYVWDIEKQPNRATDKVSHSQHRSPCLSA